MNDVYRISTLITHCMCPAFSLYIRKIFCKNEMKAFFSLATFGNQQNYQKTVTIFSWSINSHKLIPFERKPLIREIVSSQQQSLPKLSFPYRTSCDYAIFLAWMAFHIACIQSEAFWSTYVVHAYAKYRWPMRSTYALSKVIKQLGNAVCITTLVASWHSMKMSIT